MRYSRGLLGLAGLLAAFVVVPINAHGRQPGAQAQAQHDHEHQAAGETKAGGAATTQRPDMMNPEMMRMMSDMKARDAKIEALVQKMNAGRGAAKTEAMAELLTALVEDRQAMHSSMMAMGMMPMMNHTSGHEPAEHDTPKQ
jgi:hypothetical protein